jgi:glycosyltransferase involved in cell wall biosynthesis
VSAPVAVFCSFRLGGSDGVSIEATKWEWAFRELGFSTRRVAGEFDGGLRPDDVWAPFLAIEPHPSAVPERDVLAAALAGADLVVVENLCSLPLNEAASTTTAEVLEAHDGRVLFHHHDLPWERQHLAHLDAFPPRRPGSLHVTINDRARRALADRGVDAVTIRNAFDLAPLPGDREATRAHFGFGAHETVLLQPTRAIARKAVPRALAFAEQISQLIGGPVRFWLTGPAEDGYGPELDRLLEHAPIPVTVGRAPRSVDAYAAAEAVVFPSTWEGFGNPVIESVIARRPLVTARYPVLDELLALGFEFFSVDEPAALASWLEDPQTARLDANIEVARRHLDLRDLPDRISAACATVGWDEW